MATHPINLAWRIPWTEEPGRLQSMGLRRVRHDWATITQTKIRKKENKTIVKGYDKKKKKRQKFRQTYTHTPNPQTSRASCLWTERGSVSFLARLAGAFSKAHRPPLPEEAAGEQSQQRLVSSSSSSHSCLSLCLLAPSWGRTRWSGQHLVLWPSCRHSSQLQVRLDVSMEMNF